MNKYEIYVSTSDLCNFIAQHDVKDEWKFDKSLGDFYFVTPSENENHITFFNSTLSVVDGWDEESLQAELLGKGVKVSPEEFLIAIGYIPEKQKVSFSKVSSIKAEDIHYICESYQQDFLSVSESRGNALVSITEGGRESTIKLSPEGLIELGSDLVRLGVALRDGTYEH